MTRERINKELAKVQAQLEALQVRAKELEGQKQMADDAEAMRIIKKYKISADKLRMLNKLSEEEVARLLKQKEQETEGIKNEIMV